ncbi:RagB/SusD family nutrient uptake outer membrane protein [Xanthomarina gelatinilytica]|uniref:RagB/SusD family nutrient uptake outer membrane protein n=1 Tax=Xanthomarina gelatinilytica TaxID=1137281 RepID=UPI003AA9A091
MKNKINLIYAMVLMVCTVFVSCNEDDLEQTLENAKSVEGNIKTFEDLDNVVGAIYSWMTQTGYYSSYVIKYGDLRSDNAYSQNSATSVSNFNMTGADGYASSTWGAIYSTIGAVNLAIISDGVTGDSKKINHKIGEAYALRALCYFDLLRVYGQQFVTGEGGMNSLGIPYIKDFQTSNYYNARNTVAECKTFIEEDLAKAITLMTASLDDASKKYMTTNGVKALQARIALYFKEFSKARDYANEVIKSNQYNVIPLNKYVNSWKTESNENAIFELAYDNEDNSGTGSLSYTYRHPNFADIVVYDEVLNIFDANDIRIDKQMIDKDTKTPVLLRNVGKYPSEDYSDDLAIIRYEEVVLIYAEALFETGGDALPWLNLIPAQRNATLYTVANKENILLERRKELLFEGFRFDDLARTGKDIPLTSLEDATPITFGDYRYAFPISITEVRRNANVLQNKGYSN